MKKLVGITLLLALFSISNSCTKSSMYNTPSGSNTGTKGSSGPGADEVWIQSMAFNPSTITVTSGTTIIWTNKDAVNHTVTSDNALFDSGSIGTNGTYSHKFATAVTFTYHCTVHPMMTASVIVN
jgi:plastocyanin